MKILLTGGTGNLGSATLAELAASYPQVSLTALVRASSPEAARQRLGNTLLRFGVREVPRNWEIRCADLPTSKVLLARAIRQIIWVHRGPEEADVTRLLRMWQKGGVEILHLDLDAPTNASPLPSGKSLFQLWAESAAKARQLKGPKNQGFGGHVSTWSLNMPTYNWPRWSSHG